MLVHLHMSFYMSFFLGGHLKKKIPWSEMLRLGKLQKGHMDWRCIFGHHPPIPPSEDPDASHGNTRRMSQKLAAKQGESGSNEVKTVLQKIQMLKDTGYLTVLNSNIYKEYLLHSVFFPIHSPFKPTEIQAFSALRALERAWRITSMSLHIACRQLNPQLATSALKAVRKHHLSQVLGACCLLNMLSLGQNSANLTYK